ncbi:CDP-glycerol glycerophosphotransferase family protein [Peribacillus sp. NPDC097206]|uniref:CDP-glycerol glycerophosphotransferase family protein n=1 Tax=unclassified Peribacillus TaxID=2675266 RepID=UPI00381D4E40
MIQKLKFIMNILIAMIIFPIQKNKIGNNVILIGGHAGELYADNSKALFEYLSNHYENYEVYWIINQTSLDKEKINKFLTRGSVKNYLYYFKSKGLFYSHSASDIAPILHNYIKPKGVRIYLTHGIDGLKKRKYTGKDKSSIKKMADLYVTVSDFEKNIKIKEFNLDETSFILTGLPRFDNLYNNLVLNNGKKNSILYMPTWREWYKNLSTEEFIETDFYHNVKELLTSVVIIELLKKYNYQLNLNLHFYFHRFLSTLNFDNDYIKIINPNEDLQELILETKILITDYSSVCWDYFYLNKPILFYQFDQIRYEKERGAYLDLNNDLMGLKSNNLNQLIKDLNYTIQNQKKVVEDFGDFKMDYFKYHDNQNCKRVIEEFEQYLESKQN